MLLKKIATGQKLFKGSVGYVTGPMATVRLVQKEMKLKEGQAVEREASSGTK